MKNDYKKNNLAKYLRKIFSVQYDETHKIIYILGIKIRLQKYSKQTAIIAEHCAKEAYSALSVSKLHSQVFPQFKNCNIGKNVTIIGCGPTIKYYNNEANYKNIALNKAILLDNINFDYIFSFDSTILNTCPGYIDTIKQKSGIKFIGKFLNPEFKQNFPEIKHEEKHNIYRYYVSKRNGIPSLKTFEYELHSDITTYPLPDYYSIAFAALKFTLWTYPDKIYLVGLDTAQTGNFFDGPSQYHWKKMIEGYHKFKRFAQIYYPETEIISVNPIGLKGIFKDVYTKSFVKEHPELKNQKIEIIE